MSDRVKDVKVQESAEAREEIGAWLDEYLGEEHGVLLADGFEDAFVGFGEQFNTPVAVYDREECLNILMRQGDMTVEEAEEYFNFNVVGAYVGKQTPIFLTVFSPQGDDDDGYEEDDYDADEWSEDEDDDDEGAP